MYCQNRKALKILDSNVKVILLCDLKRGASKNAYKTIGHLLVGQNIKQRTKSQNKTATNQHRNGEENMEVGWSHNNVKNQPTI